MGEKWRPFLVFWVKWLPFLALCREGWGVAAPAAPPPWIRPCSDELVEGLEETVGASNQMKLLHGGLV